MNILLTLDRNYLPPLRVLGRWMLRLYKVAAKRLRKSRILQIIFK